MGNEWERLIAAVERNADASEKMLALATEEQLVMAEPGPPVCPHCGRLNPVVTQLGAGGEGSLGDFILHAETHCCNREVYAIPIGFDTAPTSDIAMDLIARRRVG